MSFAPFYLLGRLVYRFGQFFRHWYLDGTRRFAEITVSFFRSLDQAFAVGVTARHFFEPLYGDYSPVGRVLGIVFRTGRIVFGGAFAVVFGCAFFAVFLAWVALPVVLVVFSIRDVPPEEVARTVADVVVGVSRAALSTAVEYVRQELIR